MFGLKKKKPRKKSVKVVKKKTKKPETMNKTKVSKDKKRRIPDKKTVVKRGSLMIGDKAFDSPGDITAYYRAESDRIRKVTQRFKTEQAEGFLNIAKANLMKLLSQRKKFNLIARDLGEHKKVLSKKIDELHVKKVNTQANQENIQNLVEKMKFLDEEAKKILDTKEHLNQKEAELIAEMKKIAKIAKRDLHLSDLKKSSELTKFELSKEGVLARAQELLSEEAENIFSDNSLLGKLSEDAIKKVKDLNTQLAQLQGAKKETLRKRHLLEISEKDTEKTLVQTKDKIKELEEKYHALLKK